MSSNAGPTRKRSILSTSCSGGETEAHRKSGLSCSVSKAEVGKRACKLRGPEEQSPGPAPHVSYSGGHHSPSQDGGTRATCVYDVTYPAYPAWASVGRGFRKGERSSVKRESQEDGREGAGCTLNGAVRRAA